MRKLVEYIVNKNFDAANEIVAESFDLIMRRKLVEMKKLVRARDMEEQNLAMNKRYPNSASKVRAGINEEDIEESDLPITKEKQKIYVHTDKKSGREKHMTTPTPTSSDWEVKELREEDLTEAQRIKIVKARIRGGKIQRRRKVSNMPGFTMRGGQLKRMSPAERRRRKLGQRKGKIKRKAKMSRALMKRKRSLMKRRAIGLR